MGAHVDEIATYRTIRTSQPKNRDERFRSLLQAGDLDLLTFTSSSTVRNFVASFPGEDVSALLGKTQIVCIGPSTAATAQEYGLTVTIQPHDYTIPAFSEAIVEYYQK